MESIVLESPVVQSALSQAHKPGLTKRYNFIPTREAISQFEKNGWSLVSSSEVKVRKEERKGFQKHMIRMRHEQLKSPEVNDYIYEAVIVNSHDGLSSFRMFAGVFRLVCSNGMIVSNGTFDLMRILHKSMREINIPDITSNYINRIGLLSRDIENWKSISLSHDLQIEYANRSIKSRWEDKNPGVGPLDLIRIKRDADSKSDLWTVFNRVQEHIMKGGIEYVRNPEEKLSRRWHHTTGVTRPVKSISRFIGTNQELWDLTSKFYNEIK